MGTTRLQRGYGQPYPQANGPVGYLAVDGTDTVEGSIEHKQRLRSSYSHNLLPDPGARRGLGSPRSTRLTTAARPARACHHEADLGIHSVCCPDLGTAMIFGRRY